MLTVNLGLCRNIFFAEGFLVVPYVAILAGAFYSFFENLALTARNI